MSQHWPRYNLCLQHQLPEDQTSPIGLVCSCCKQRLYVEPPQGARLNFWESQPAAYTLDRKPCFVFSIRWDDFSIRSLHPAGSDFDPRSRPFTPATYID